MSPAEGRAPWLAPALFAAALALLGAAPRQPGVTGTPPAGPEKVGSSPASKRAIADSAVVLAVLDGVVNTTCPLPGVVTGGQPGAAHLARLARVGYRTVLDMRLPEEPRGYDEAAEMRAAGLRYVVLPVTSATLDDARMDEFRELMRATDTTGVFVHCASGNRVGAVMIPWLVLDRGWELERALKVARAGGLRSDALEARARDYVSRRRTAR